MTGASGGDHIYIQARDSIQRWMRSVMLDHQWSAEEWARKAQTSATNITRALANGEVSLPNTLTLVQLAKVAGTPPDLLGKPPTDSEMSVPLLDGAQVREYLLLNPKDRVAWLVRASRAYPAMQIRSRPSPTGFAVTLETDSLSGRSILKGDIAVLEPDMFGPEDSGEIVVVRCDSRIGAWLYYPPLLVPASETMEPTPIKGAQILGRLRQIVRSYG